MSLFLYILILITSSTIQDFSTPENMMVILDLLFPVFCLTHLVQSLYKPFKYTPETSLAIGSPLLITDNTSLALWSSSSHDELLLSQLGKPHQALFSVPKKYHCPYFKAEEMRCIEISSQSMKGIRLNPGWISAVLPPFFYLSIYHLDTKYHLFLQQSCAPFTLNSSSFLEISREFFHFHSPLENDVHYLEHLFFLLASFFSSSKIQFILRALQGQNYVLFIIFHLQHCVFT